MLKSFSVENYKNFSDKLTLSFDSVRKYNFNNQYVKDGLLNKILVVGKNACGKTNLGFALFDIVYTLTDNYRHPLQVDGPSFLNGSTRKGYAEFVYEFADRGKTYEYTYRKTAPTVIIYESLKVDGETVFARDGQKGDYVGLSGYNAGQLRIDLGDGSLSVLRFIVNNTLQSEDSPLKYIMDFANGMLYFKTDQEGNMFMGLHKSSSLISEYIINNGLVTEFNKILRDIGEIDINLETVRVGGMQNVLVQNLGNKKLVFDAIASSGTKTFMLFYYWYKQFGKVTFLFMDEFDAYYHYEMAEKVLKLVAEMDSFQTVFTSHNTTLIGNNVLRPDCYMLLEKGVLKNFPDRTDREIREGHNIEKMYRNGEFDE